MYLKRFLFLLVAMKNNQTNVRATFMGIKPGQVEGNYACFKLPGRESRSILVDGNTSALSALPVGTKVDLVYGKRLFGYEGSFLRVETPKTTVYQR
jgi:hypothetical protein